MRFRVSLEGEIIRKIDANCGYIHRGIEKMNESLYISADIGID